MEPSTVGHGNVAQQLGVRETISYRCLLELCVLKQCGQLGAQSASSIGNMKIENVFFLTTSAGVSTVASSCRPSKVFINSSIAAAKSISRARGGVLRMRITISHVPLGSETQS